MKTSWLLAGLSAFVFTSVSTMAAQSWGYKELKESEDVVLGLYLTEVGAKSEEEVLTAKNNIEAYSVKRGATGKSASVSLTYRKEAQKVTLSKFCHEHDAPGEIDCH